MKRTSRSMRIPRICNTGRQTRQKESQPRRFTATCRELLETVWARSVPIPPRTSQLNRMRAMINSFPLNCAKNSRMVRSWVTTDEIPVAITTLFMASSFFFFKILNLVDQDFKFGVFPGMQKDRPLRKGGKEKYQAQAAVSKPGVKRWRLHVLCGLLRRQH